MHPDPPTAAVQVIVLSPAAQLGFGGPGQVGVGVAVGVAVAVGLRVGEGLGVCAYPHGAAKMIARAIAATAAT